MFGTSTAGDPRQGSEAVMGALRDKLDAAWDAFHRNEYDEGMGHFHPECSVVVPAVGTLDWAQWKGLVQAHYDGHSDFLVTITHSVEDDETVAFLWKATGTHDGYIPHPDGHCPPTAAELDVHGAGYVRVSDGLIADYHLYFDNED